MDSCFLDYNLNFFRIKNWIKQHELNITKHEFFKNNAVKKRQRSNEYSERKKSRNKKKKKAKQKSSSQCSDEAYNESEEFEMNITEEMKNFFRISQEHKKNKGLISISIFMYPIINAITLTEILKKEALESLKDSQPMHSKTIQSTPERITEEEEMKKFYGEDWKRIKELEDTLAVQYNKNFKAFQPNYWPSMPL